MANKFLSIALVSLLACTEASVVCRASEDAKPTDAGSSLYVKVQLDRPRKFSKLRPGDTVAGTLSRDVYSADRELFRAGSPVRLTVDHLEKRRRPPDDHWPGVVKLFTPRRESWPVFKTATVGLGEAERSLQVSLISISRLRDVHAMAPSKKKNKSGESTAENKGAVEVSQPYTKKSPTPTMIFEASTIEPASQEDSPRENSSDTRDESAPSAILPSGTRCRILLLGDVSASKSKPGDVIHARLIEPVTLDSKVVLPVGSVFEGKVIKRTPPRWLSRSGSLYLTFTELTVPDGAHVPITAMLVGAELDRQSHTRIDSEGRLRGERPGKVWMAINIGVTAGLAKEVDDSVQLIVEALVSTATDASTAGTARIVSSCVSGIYMATRKGRDVILPRFTEMDISLDRPVSLNPPKVATAAMSGK